jgi:excisionase family DNA binding protein
MMNVPTNAPVRQRRKRRKPAADVELLEWAATQLGIGRSTAYRLAESGQLPGAFKVGAQWRVSVPRFLAEIHGGSGDAA